MNNSATRSRDLSPPEELMFVGGGLENFKVIGEAFVRDFQSRCGLQPHERVLDVGCGVGRIAIPLTEFLNSEGRYEGFDIVAKGIEWCQQNITPQHPNFSFRLADVYNKQYHPSGKQKGSRYRFPYDDASFDFVCLTSVFTHMLPRDMKNYFREISRVLTIGGRCMITFFLLNKESLDAINAGKSTISFDHAFKQYRVHSLESPEGAVSYDERYILNLYQANGLEVEPPLLHGVWSGRTSEYLGYQDIIVAHKRRLNPLQKTKVVLPPLSDEHQPVRKNQVLAKILLKESRDDLKTFLEKRQLPRGVLRGSFNFGYCPICETRTVFIVRKDWLRDFYHCARCQSIPRWRALIHILQTHFPNWRELRLHESSPGGASSEKLKRECPNYLASHLFTEVTPGEMKHGFRCENLEQQTFEDAEFDLVVTQDVFEHILDPASAFSEIARTLKPGGAHVFTVPWYYWKKTLVRAIRENGSIRHLEEPDYHGNPIDPNGSLVVREWGWDLCDFIYQHSGMATTAIRINDESRGIKAEFIEVFISRKTE